MSIMSRRRQKDAKASKVKEVQKPAEAPKNVQNKQGPQSKALQQGRR